MATTTRIGTTFIVLSQLLDRLVSGNYRGRNAIKDELVRLVQRGGGTNTRIDIDLNGRSVAGGFTPLVLVEDVNLGNLKAPRNFVF
ncbi:MAG: hypothetical protein HC827_00715 [Cyanobacteria bacterium RM1_2_2]|nr:hypothetical protein [Cyanobacteria bacterium RM1_2_2]